ncbi:MAG: hypothetical protein U0165_03685 [Polyangiaceae bacterium]
MSTFARFSGHTVIAAAWVAPLAVVGLVHADAPALPSCPAGSSPTVMQGEAFCAPSKVPCVPGAHFEVFGPGQAFCVEDEPCPPNDECPGTRSCSDAPHCVKEARPKPADSSFAVTRVIEGCGAGSSCPQDSTCKVARICLEDPEKIENKRREEEAERRKADRELVKQRLIEHEEGNRRAIKAGLKVIAFVACFALFIAWQIFKPKKS